MVLDIFFFNLNNRFLVEKECYVCFTCTYRFSDTKFNSVETLLRSSFTYVDIFLSNFYVFWNSGLRRDIWTIVDSL